MWTRGSLDKNMRDFKMADTLLDPAGSKRALGAVT